MGRCYDSVTVKGQALGGVATSQEPFDQQFPDSVKEIHGVDLANDPPAEVTEVIDWRA